VFSVLLLEYSTLDTSQSDLVVDEMFPVCGQKCILGKI